MRKIFLAIFLAFISIATAFAVDFPQKPTNFINDYTETLSSETVANLNALLADYEKQTGTEITIVLIATTEGMPIADYATKLGNAWGVGKRDVDNGALLLIAKNDRELFIATGSQTEGGLTDLEANNIINFVMVPRFKEGNFDAGVSAGVESMIAALKGESFTDLRMEDGAGNSGEDWLNWIMFFVFFLLPWGGAILGRSKEIWPGAVLGIIGGMILGLVFTMGWLTIVIVIFFGLSGLFFDWIVSKNYDAAKKSGHDPSWWAGGGGWKGGGGGGFGGFGGGGFSGGGSGGRW